jgi:xylan 1,4-beta-xylosidase
LSEAETFANPVIGGFFPDPSICRVGEDYYLACSSFEYFPGVPIFHSRDLVHWRQIGNVLDRPEQLRLDTARASGGIYAPTLRYHDGRFWLIVTNVSDRGTLLVTSDRPEGPWSDPVWLSGVPGVDPDLAWDGDGNCWCTSSGIQQVRIDPEAGKVLEEPRTLWSGTPGAQWPEAPHLYQVGGWWYLLIAEGGTERGHCVSVARGPSPQGPFEPCPDNPILTHRSTNRPIQNTGHADLVQAHDGSWWLVFLGVRLRGQTPGFHVLGRETYLAPVSWVDGWPVVGEVSETMAAPALPAHPFPEVPSRDDFDDDVLQPSWVSVRSRPAEAWSLRERPGWLTLHARGNGLDDPAVTFVGRRQQHLACEVRALVQAEGAGGLAVRMDERHHYGVEVGDGVVYAYARVGQLRQRLGERRVPDGAVVLRVEVHPDLPGRGPAHLQTGDGLAGAPDVVRLGYEVDGDFAVLAELDGRYLSTEVAAGFTGRVIGMYAAQGTVHFDWFDHRPS